MNCINLIGRITKNIELKTSMSGTSYCKFTVAVDDRKMKDKDKTTSFISCAVFGKRAEFLEKYFSKGVRVGLTGALKCDSYEREDGTKVYTATVMVDNIYFADSKESGGGYSRPTSENAPKSADPSEFDEDDVPF
jgi:single-strand DNA-binding protein